MPADRLAPGLPAGVRMCAASCQGQLGKKREQSGHSLHGEWLWGMGAELRRQGLQGPHEHWVQLPGEEQLAFTIRRDQDEGTKHRPARSFHLVKEHGEGESPRVETLCTARS